MIKNKIFIIAFILISTIYGCKKSPDKMDRRIDNFRLPDKSYDISVFRDPTGGVYASDIIDVYYDHRNGNYQIINSFYYEPPYLSSIIRIDKSYAIFIHRNSDSIPLDTTYIELK